MDKKLLAVVILVALSMFGSGLVSGRDQEKSNVITKFGEYELFNGKLSVKVSEADENLSVRMTPSSLPKRTFTLNLPSKKGAFWLVYPESANRIWFFRDPDLLEGELTDENTSTVRGHASLKKAPKALLDALPEDVRQRLGSK